MPKVFFSGKLSLPMKLLAQMNFAIAWVIGNTRNTTTMKQNWKLGYDGAVTDHVLRFDELGVDHYKKIGTKLIEKIDLKGKEVLDVGCGSGIVSQIILENNAKKLMSGDLSENMLNQWRSKVKKLGYDKDRIEFRQIDAEALPFDDDSFDIVISSMMLGQVPEQKKVLSEMKRVLRPNGALAIATQGPNYYSPALDCVLRVSLRYIIYLLGYRVEYWPVNEKYLLNLLSQTGFINIKTYRDQWFDKFKTASDAFDFTASTSSMWFMLKFPKEKRKKIAQMYHDYFLRKKIDQIEQDVIMAYATAP